MMIFNLGFKSYGINILVKISLIFTTTQCTYHDTAQPLWHVQIWLVFNEVLNNTKNTFRTNLYYDWKYLWWKLFQVFSWHLKAYHSSCCTLLGHFVEYLINLVKASGPQRSHIIESTHTVCRPMVYHTRYVYTVALFLLLWQCHISWRIYLSPYPAKLLHWHWDNWMCTLFLINHNKT